MKGKVKIAVIDPLSQKEMTKEVDADVFGIVAVTKYMQPFTNGYVITHVETGRAMSRLITRKSAAALLAKKINAHADQFTGLSTKRLTKRNRAAGLLLRELWVEVGLRPWW